MFSRAGTLLPSIYADTRFIDAVVVSKDVVTLCRHRNLVVHEDVQHSVPTIKQHAMACNKVLNALKVVYPM